MVENSCFIFLSTVSPLAVVLRISNIKNYIIHNTIGSQKIKSPLVNERNLHFVAKGLSQITDTAHKLYTSTQTMIMNYYNTSMKQFIKITQL